MVRRIKPRYRVSPASGGGRSAPESGLPSCCSIRRRKNRSRRIRCGGSGSAGSSGARPCSARSRRRSGQCRRFARLSAQSRGLRPRSSIAAERRALPCPAGLPPPFCPGLPATWKRNPDSRDEAPRETYPEYQRWQKFRPAQKFQPKPRRTGTARAAAPSELPPVAFPFNVTPFYAYFYSKHFSIFLPDCTSLLPNGRGAQK